MKIISRSADQTKKLGRLLAETILQTKPGKRALVLALQGDLGGGKTTFVQGLAQGLGIKDYLTSPTFVIMKSYVVGTGQCPVPTEKTILHLYLPLPEEEGGFTNFYHIDCYRLKNEKDLQVLGIEEILADPRNIAAIEWAEKVKKILSYDRIDIKFSVANQKTRKIILKRQNPKLKFQTKPK